MGTEHASTCVKMFIVYDTAYERMGAVTFWEKGVGLWRGESGRIKKQVESRKRGMGICNRQ